jgi:hypothetical protein
MRDQTCSRCNTYKTGKCYIDKRPVCRACFTEEEVTEYVLSGSISREMLGLTIKHKQAIIKELVRDDKRKKQAENSEQKPDSSG